jgi:hypothetical protein
MSEGAQGGQNPGPFTFGRDRRRRGRGRIRSTRRVGAVIANANFATTLATGKAIHKAKAAAAGSSGHAGREQLPYGLGKVRQVLCKSIIFDRGVLGLR